MSRSFTASPAVRKNVPLLLAIFGPSGCGKSFSAMRVATGIARVQKKPIYVIDTEADRALQYADRFQFQHVPFVAPFGSLDYLDALDFCVKQGAGTVIIDQISSEHEGPGGMLDSAEKWLDEKCGDDWKKRDRMKMGSFIKPKSNRSKLIQYMVQCHANLILCFRAKEKIKPRPGQDPINLGWQPIAGDEFAYEMTARALLLPGSNGVPEWAPQEVGEKLMARRPEQFRTILADGKQLSEDMGEQMARWAAGDATPVPKAGNKSAALSAINQAVDEAAFMTIADGLNKRTWSEADHQEIHAAIETRRNDLTKE